MARCILASVHTHSSPFIPHFFNISPHPLSLTIRTCTCIPIPQFRLLWLSLFQLKVVLRSQNETYWSLYNYNNSEVHKLYNTLYNIHIHTLYTAHHACVMRTFSCPYRNVLSTHPPTQIGLRNGSAHSNSHCHRHPGSLRAAWQEQV